MGVLKYWGYDLCAGVLCVLVDIVSVPWVHRLRYAHQKNLGSNVSLFIIDPVGPIIQQHLHEKYYI